MCKDAPCIWSRRIMTIRVFLVDSGTGIYASVIMKAENYKLIVGI
jgi:hypothetical protein